MMPNTGQGRRTPGVRRTRAAHGTVRPKCNHCKNSYYGKTNSVNLAHPPSCGAQAAVVSCCEWIYFCVVMPTVKKRMEIFS
eukprot:24728_6